MNFNPDLERTDKSSEKFKKYLIVDASGITAIDSMGVKCIDELAEELKKHDVRLLISNCKGNVRQMCESCGLYKKVSKCDFFPSNHDAMLNARFYYSLAQSKDEATLNE
uniref:STAS domain-containing protein n=1 Tax=Rhabditophanes sp. KR3021 TaxID=114890 RepID=A0AC35TFV5_9BILA